MTYRYAQIDDEGYVVSDSYLSGEVIMDNMIPLEMDFDLTNKKLNMETREWEEYIPPTPPTPPVVTNEDLSDQLIIVMEGIADLYETVLGG